MLKQIDELDKTASLEELLYLKDKLNKSNLKLACHAEENAILTYQSKMGAKHRKNIPHRKLHMVVLRINGAGKLCDSKPCSNCADFMLKYGIRKVTYSINETEFITCNINELTTRKSVGYQSVERAIKILDDMINNKQHNIQ